MTEKDAPHESQRVLAETFRQAMRRLVATVTIITAGDTTSRAGMAATAVMSVSAEPPSLAVGIRRDASAWATIRSSGRFGVNLLARQHAPLVLPFGGAMQGEERFAMGTWERHASHTPYLVDAVATLFCRVDGALDYGTHTLFVGVVEDVRLHDESTVPLLWQDGGLANAVPLDELLT